ncbi:TolC family protein [Avibacterium sp. 21-599]|uniref:TolC family protein n=1 Tax=Avibacterium sp. 21-599 TaxID=2911528 RepID=UPI002246ED0A|nr:TolC family protein [Avibacterium sp. 21-599]MCW9717134.1 TolC family protein [Avibacterium sp. 21-599]
MQFDDNARNALRGFRFNTLFALLSTTLLVGCQHPATHPIQHNSDKHPIQAQIEQVKMGNLLASASTVANPHNEAHTTQPAQYNSDNHPTQASIEQVKLGKVITASTATSAKTATATASTSPSTPPQPEPQRYSLAPLQLTNPVPTTQSNATAPVAVQPLVMQIIASSREGKPVQAILQSALTYFDNHASADALIAQRQAETTATERQAYPDIRPVAGVGKNHTAQFGLEVNYTLFDFGQNDTQVTQRQLTTESAIINKHLEQTKRLSETLIKLGEVAERQARIALTQNTLANINQLLQLAQSRQASGVDNGSDEMLLSIKSAELTTEIQTLKKQLDLSLSLLSRQLIRPISLNDVPTLTQLLAVINTPVADLNQAPQLQQAEKFIERAKAAVEAEKKSLYPKVVVTAGGYKNVKGQSDTQLNVSLQAPTGIFAGSARVNAQEAALLAAQRDYERLADDIRTERSRLDLETDRLQQNLQTFDAFIAQTQRSIDLFNRQFEISQASIADGISPYSTLLRTKIERNNALLELIRIKANRLPLVLPSTLAEK